MKKKSYFVACGISLIVIVTAGIIGSSIQRLDFGNPVFYGQRDDPFGPQGVARGFKYAEQRDIGNQ